MAEFKERNRPHSPIDIRFDKICDVFETHFKAGHAALLSEYLAELDLDSRARAFSELIRVDLDLREARREQLLVEDYLSRYPDYRTQVVEAFYQHEFARTTPNRTQPSGPLSNDATQNFQDEKTRPGYLEVRCPNCSSPIEVAVDTQLTDLTCETCGSHFSLVDQAQATRLAPSLTQLGRFELIERLGVGGFGSVWKARDRELDRTVAIKIPRASAMTAEEQEKFFREARAAAQLRHPNIIAVHEVGRDGDSVYIVSDFVRGVTLGDWFTGQRVTGREAAEICGEIAEALHYAHEKGVVHRDLKPANILMDGERRPHLMDFGLAKRDVGEMTVTVDGQVLGTPAYMSPEQAEGNAHNADRRSDIYSLGVILFQLLTGELPFRGNARMLLHQVINDEPPSPRSLNSNIAKDLSTVTLKCLEKRPDKRYQNAEMFAEELRRYLRGEPISARPVGSFDRTWRWAKRRPASAALLAMLVLGIVGSVIGWIRERELLHEVAQQYSEIQRQVIEAQKQREVADARTKEAEAERNNAQAVVHFLTDDMLAKSSPENTPDRAVRDTLVSSLIEPAAATVGERLKDKPLIEAAVREAIASALKSIGAPEKALVHAQRAFDLRQAQLGQDHPDTVSSLNTVALVKEAISREDEFSTFAEILAKRRKILGEEHPDTIESFINFGSACIALYRYSEAQAYTSRALQLAQQVLGDDHPTTIRARRVHGRVLIGLGRVNEAEPLIKYALEQNRRLLGDDHPTTIANLQEYADALSSMKRFDEASQALQQVLTQRRKVFGADHPNTLVAVKSLANTYVRAGRLDDAMLQNSVLLRNRCFFNSLQCCTGSYPLFRQTVDAALGTSMDKKLLPIDNLVLGEILLVAGNPAKAEEAIRAAIGSDKPKHYYYKSLGWCLLTNKRPAEAKDAFTRSLQICEVPLDDPKFDFTQVTDGDLLTAAYFLDLISEQQFGDQLKESNRSCMPWFYIAQRDEISGDKDAARAAYYRSIEAAVADAQIFQQFARYRLSQLGDLAQGAERDPLAKKP